MKLKVILAAALSATFMVAACGGGSSSDDSADTEAITALVAEMNRVTKEKDAAGFCAVVQPSGIESVFKSKARCVKETKQILDQVGEQPELKVEGVAIEGDRATVDLEGKAGEVVVVKEDGKWYAPLSSGEATEEAPTESTETDE